jgi:hypothetical protein
MVPEACIPIAQVRITSNLEEICVCWMYLFGDVIRRFPLNGMQSSERRDLDTTVGVLRASVNWDQNMPSRRS